jgi:hypothetical protein
VTSAPLLPHLASGVRRCSAIAIRLGVEYAFFGLPSLSFAASNETFQQDSARPGSSGWDRGHPPLPLSSSLNFLVLEDAP